MGVMILGGVMLFIGGTKGRTVHGRFIEDLLCPNCRRTRHQAIAEIRYFHLYWIPVIPTERKVFVSCCHCSHTQEEIEIPAPLAADLKKALVGPIKMAPLFAGSFLIALILVISVISGGRIAARESGYLEDPHLADIYVLYLPDIFESDEPAYPYGVFRVVAVSPVDVECQVGKLIYDILSGPKADIKDHKTDSDDYYEEEYFTFPRDDLLEMKRSGTIEKVHRPSE
jgi:hypothetical protein